MCVCVCSRGFFIPYLSISFLIISTNLTLKEKKRMRARARPHACRQQTDRRLGTDGNIITIIVRRRSTYVRSFWTTSYIKSYTRILHSRPTTILCSTILHMFELPSPAYSEQDEPAAIHTCISTCTTNILRIRICCFCSHGTYVFCSLARCVLRWICMHACMHATLILFRDESKDVISRSSKRLRQQQQ